jgi:phosphatidylserine decarboxylase
MRMTDTSIKPMHREGRMFVAMFAAITLALLLVEDVFGWVGVGLTVWCYSFFRDPERVTPDRHGLLISPADGIMSLIKPAISQREPGVRAFQHG